MLGRKKCLGSHQLHRLIFTNKKMSYAPYQILILGKQVMCMHLSEDMVFLNAVVIFIFFYEN